MNVVRAKNRRAHIRIRSQKEEREKLRRERGKEGKKQILLW